MSVGLTPFERRMEEAGITVTSATRPSGLRKHEWREHGRLMSWSEVDAFLKGGQPPLSPLRRFAKFLRDLAIRGGASDAR